VIEIDDLLNYERAQWVLRQNDLDAMLAALPENWLYLTGQEDTIAGTLGLPTLALLTLQPLGLRAVTVPRLSAGFAAAATGRVDEIVLYGDFPVNIDSRELNELEQRTVALLEDGGAAASMPEGVESMLTRCGLQDGRIAVDDWSVASMLEEKLPSCRCIPGKKLFEQIRAVKTPGEVARLRAAVSIVEQLEVLAFEHARPGHVWDDFVVALPKAAAERDARLGFFSGGAGRRSAYMFPPAADAIQAGDLIRLDITISHRGYWADTGRSASVGTPSQEASARYRTIRDAVDAAIEVARPGASFADLYDAAMRVAQRSMRDYRRRHCGHTIGARPYDGLLVAPEETTRLEANMVLNIEVPFYGIGWGGLQLEDTLLITESGCLPLTKLSRELVTLHT
jgi:Xaa-Pro dipeptidase